jgi:hypothetical protein
MLETFYQSQGKSNKHLPNDSWSLMLFDAPLDAGFDRFGG